MCAVATNVSPTGPGVVGSFGGVVGSVGGVVGSFGGVLEVQVAEDGTLDDWGLLVGPADASKDAELVGTATGVGAGDGTGAGSTTGVASTDAAGEGCKGSAEAATDGKGRMPKAMTATTEAAVLIIIVAPTVRAPSTRGVCLNPAGRSSNRHPTANSSSATGSRSRAKL